MSISFKLGSGFARLYLHGIIRYGKSHMLTALACMFLPADAEESFPVSFSVPSVLLLIPPQLHTVNAVLSLPSKRCRSSASVKHI